MSFSFGTPKTDANTMGGFAFGGSGAGDAKTGAAKPFSFSTPPASTTSFNLGGFGAPTTTPSTGFSLGATSAGLNLTTTTASATSVTPTFNLGATPTSTGLGFGTTSTAGTGGFSFGAASTGLATATGSPAFKLGGTAPPASASASTLTATASAPATGTPGFGLLDTPKTVVPAVTTIAAGFTLGSTPAATTTATSLSLGGTAATSVPSFGFGTTTSVSAAKTTTATVAPSFSLGGSAKTTATGFSLTTPAISTTAALTTSSALPATGNLNFGQLVDAINKWTIDLEEQGKLFSNQAKQLNAWDRLLVSNGEKVLSLNSGIERVKHQQQQLDQELDFVLAQQKELEDLITPLEKELSDLPLNDVDRLHTYQLAENMDTQLKQMSEDLKEIIEQLNESNKTQENSNPITQIRKILNAHMDSLQWIDRHTSKITGHLDQISKMHDLHRKSHEHSLKKTYD